MAVLERQVTTDVAPTVTGGSPGLDTAASGPERLREVRRAIGVGVARPVSDTGSILDGEGKVIGSIDMREVADYHQDSAVRAAKADKSGRSGVVHEVKAGETLIKIARANGISLQSLVDANPIFKRDDPNIIKPGMELVVPPKK